ncbi:MAG: DUF1272 domain-containing protein [Solirubrobacteraceae bacterium]
MDGRCPNCGGELLSRPRRVGPPITSSNS